MKNCDQKKISFPIKDFWLNTSGIKEDKYE